MPAKIITIAPTGSNVLIKPIERESVTKGGIVLPDNVKETGVSQVGVVVAVGPGRLRPPAYDTVIEMEVGPGARVMYPRRAGYEVEFEREKYRIIDVQEILATF